MSKMKIIMSKVLTMFLTSLMMTLVLYTSPALAATTVDLGTADSFVILGGSGITNTGPTTINGDVGTFPTTTETGFGSVTLAGMNHAGDAVTQGAKIDLTTAYGDAAGRTGAITIAGGELGGRTLIPGVYKDDGAPASLAITGTLTLDALGDSTAVFIFQSASTLTTASGSKVSLVNGAQPCNVFWQVGSSATLGTTTDFVGNILASESITLTTGATISGRALARNGAVTMDSNTITASACGVPSTVPTLGKSFSPATINTGAVSTLTITLSNPSPSVATLTAPLIDNLPGGVEIAPTPDASTTCGGTLTTPSSGDTAVTLLIGTTIPASSSSIVGTCTVKVDVTAETAAPYHNTLPIEALQTDRGSNSAPASATLTVVGRQSPPPPVPELPTLVLISSGILGLLLMGRKRKD
ncbi:MAG: ice-binding family protein [Candidatus Methanoperedens sp.]|nr:ice-binding family protein [Candidatus Methanoperedens sp.]